jgi:hypothetical protein
MVEKARLLELYEATGDPYATPGRVIELDPAPTSPATR